MSDARPSTSSGQRFAAALAVVLRHEGGFVHHPLDPGGATNLGVTRRTLAAARGRPVSVAEVRALTRTEAAAIYRRLYWTAVKADALPAGLDLSVFDLAVNSGPDRAARLLQRALGMPEDGRVGPRTLAAAASCDPAATVRALARERLRFLSRLKTWKAFGRGWRRRVEDVEAQSLALAAAPRAAPSRPASPPTSALKGTPMTDLKSPLASKTVWANLIGLAVLAGGFFGIEAAPLDQGALAEAAAELVAAASFIASTVFRLTATKRLT